MKENKEFLYTIGCDVDEALLQKIIEHIEQTKNTIRIVNLKGLSEEDLREVFVDEYIFENTGDRKNIDIAKKLKGNNSNLAAHSLDYCLGNFDEVKYIDEAIKRNDIYILSNTIDFSSEEKTLRDVYHFLSNVDSAYSQFMKNRTLELKYNAQINSKDLYDVELIADFAIAIQDRIGTKDGYTQGHVDRVSSLCELLATEEGRSAEEIEEQVVMARLHDTGKLFTPSNILKKKGGISKEELPIMQRHSKDGAEFLRPFFEQKFGKVDENGKKTLTPKLKRILDGVKYHHVDYKDAPEYEEIVGILSLADSFDAMTSDRGYNLPKTLGEVIADISKNAGSQFSPKAAETFVKYLTGRDEVNLEEYAKLFVEKKDDLETIKRKIAQQNTLVLPERKQELEQIMHTHFIDLEEKVKDYNDKFDPTFKIGEIKPDKNLFDAIKSYLNEQGKEITSNMLSETNWNEAHNFETMEKEPAIERFFTNIKNRIKRTFSKNKQLPEAAKGEENLSQQPVSYFEKLREETNNENEINSNKSEVENLNVNKDTKENDIKY